MLIKVVRQGVPLSSSGGTRPRSRADDRPEAVPVLLHQPTPPNGARVHRVGAPGPAPDGSSEEAFRVGYAAVGPVRLATIHQAGNHHGAELAVVAPSRLTGVATVRWSLRESPWWNGEG